MLKISYILLICFFVYIHGHPLDNNEERTAFENIDIANKGINEQIDIFITLGFLVCQFEQCVALFHNIFIFINFRS